MGISFGLGLLGLLGAFFLVFVARSSFHARQLGPSGASGPGVRLEPTALPPADIDFRPVGRLERDDGFEPVRTPEVHDVADGVFRPVGPVRRVNGKQPVRRCRVCGRPRSEGLHNH